MYALGASADLSIQVVDRLKKHRADIELSELVVGFRKSHVVPLQYVGKDEPPTPEAARPGIGHPFRKEMPAVLK